MAAGAASRDVCGKRGWFSEKPYIRQAAQRQTARKDTRLIGDAAMAASLNPAALTSHSP